MKTLARLLNHSLTRLTAVMITIALSVLTVPISAAVWAFHALRQWWAAQRP